MSILNNQRDADRFGKKTQSKKRDDDAPFYKLMSKELRQLYELNLLDAPAYVLLIVKTQRTAGWKWTFKVRDFCKEWGLNERTFYRAVSKLKTMGLLHWETAETITVWHSADVARDDSEDMSINTLTPVSPPKDIGINTLTPVSVTVSRVSVPVTPMTKLVTPMTQQTAETIVSSSADETSDINQIYLDPTDNVVVDEKAFESKEKEKAISEIRRLGIERNESVLALLKKHKVNVPDALAYIQQRQGEGETFGNITGAFVDALRKGKKPIYTEASFGLHKDINPPTEQQLQALEDARSGRLILDYFFSSIDNTYKVILLDGITQMPWWQYLDT